jgi:YD repeat-containing protein
MAQMNGKLEQKQAEPGEFRAVLTPYRSLGPTGFLILMTALASISFATGLAFYLIGAWPVLGFFGLDVALIYFAFKLNYRSGRLYETVELTPECLTVTRVHPSGRTERYTYNPYWARVRLIERPDGRTHLRIASHGLEQTFGRFLTDAERRDFAAALQGALLAARGGPRI